jgi:hypothetical protein
MIADITAEDAFQKAQQIALRIKNSLPEKIEAASFTLNSKLPFKAVSVRETLLHRVSDLASPAVFLFKEGNFIAGIVLTRAVLETVAVTFALKREIESFLSSKRIQEFDDFLMACLVGSRWPDAETPARNVLTFLNHVDKKFQGYRSTYDSLCEYAHPNWSGVLGSFGSIEHEAHILHLGRTDRGATLSIGITALAMSLGLFEYAYNEMIDLLKMLNDNFEDDSGST